MPLEVALERLLEQHGLKFVGFQRLGSHGGKVSLRTPKTYRMLSATVPKDLQDRDAIDDLIYDGLKLQLEADVPG